MTRDQAVNRAEVVAKAFYAEKRPDYSPNALLVDQLVALGVLKLDKPAIPPRFWEMVKVKNYSTIDADVVLTIIHEAGLKIVEA